MRFTRRELEKGEFVGWTTFPELRSKINTVPVSPGVYVVVYSAGNPTSWLEKSVGGWFKERDPTVPTEALIANWVEGAEVVYIGMSAARSGLRGRLKAFADFGAGKPIGHSGGRLIWQLPNTAALLAAWKETPDRAPLHVEAELIEAFRAIHGKPPFANNPHLLGR